MAIFDFTNFERQGNIKNDTQLDSAQDFAQTIVENTDNTLRTIKIFTHDLEPEIYNNDEFRKSLLGFTRGNRHAKIQILAKDLTNALHNGHKLINLAQQLTSVVTIKDIPEEHHQINSSFILFDQSRFIYKPDNNSHKAISSNCKNRSDRLNEFFMLIWEHAEKNTQTHSLII